MTEPQQPNAAQDDHLEEEHDDAVIGKALKYSAIAFVVLASAVGGGVWFATRPDTVSVDEGPPPRPPELPPELDIGLPSIPLVDVTTEAGITFRHENGAAGEKLIPEMMGGGVAIIDFDIDDDPDIVFINSSRWPWDQADDDQTPAATMSAWRNDGDWKFTDVTHDIGLDISLYGQGVAVGDYDRDGDPDLYITAVGPNRLLENRDGVFVDVTDSSGVSGADTDWSSSAGFFDYDNDGDLDLFVCNYLEWSREYDVAQPFRLVDDERAYGRPSAFAGTYPILFENKGNGTFEDVSEAAGIQLVSTSNEPQAKSLGVTFCDVDEDGWLDVLVANDTVQNYLFRNKGDGTFEEIARAVGIAFNDKGRARGAMGVHVEWFRNDRTIGIAIGNFANEMTALYVANPDNMLFRDEALPTGLGPDTRVALTFGVAWADMDLDGRLDLLAANGHIETDINRVQPTQHYAQPPQLFWNCGPESLTEFVQLSAEQCGNEFLKPMVGRSVVTADFDTDGDPDVLLTACGEAPRLLRNDQSLNNNWLRVHAAPGAVVELHAGGIVQRRLVNRARGYLTAGEKSVLFGLGNIDEIAKLRVLERGSQKWLDFPNPTINTRLGIDTVSGRRSRSQPSTPPRIN